jgi:4-hydroxybutyrate dehydrogenase
VFLPAVIAFNAQAALGPPGAAPGAHGPGNGPGLGASDIGPAIRDMNARLGSAIRTGSMGVTAAQFDRIIDGALADHCHKTNPRIATRDEYRGMLEQSM